MKKLIISPENPNGIEVGLTAEEILEVQKYAVEGKKVMEKEQIAKQAKADTKASALAKLSALGLTEEEVQAIIK
jgi:hypothetical protein